MSQQVGAEVKPQGVLLRIFPAMQYLEYRRMFYAAGLSAISLWAMITARGWLGYELTGNPSGTAIVTFAAIGPWVLAPIGGALADRFDRARIVIVCRFGAALTAIGLAILAFSGQIEMWNLVLITLVSGIIRSGEMPAQQALLPNTVKMHALLSAITMASMMQFGSKVIGPVAGPILKAFGPEWVFAAAAVFLLLSILQMTRMTTRSTGGIQGHTGGLMRDSARHIRDGLRYLGQAPSVRLMIAMVSLHCMFTMAFDFSLLPAYADLILGGGQSEYGYMLMAIGGGALVSTVILSMLPMGAIRGPGVHGHRDIFRSVAGLGRICGFTADGNDRRGARRSEPGDVHGLDQRDDPGGRARFRARAGDVALCDVRRRDHGGDDPGQRAGGGLHQYPTAADRSRLHFRGDHDHRAGLAAHPIGHS